MKRHLLPLMFLAALQTFAAPVASATTIDLGAEASRSAPNDLARATLFAEATGPAPADAAKKVNAQIGEAPCPSNAFASSTVVCRSSIGVCDVAENCTGSSSVCPSDAFAASTVVCRTSAGVCDVAENCTGAAAACPTDSFACGRKAFRAARLSSPPPRLSWL